MERKKKQDQPTSPASLEQSQVATPDAEENCLAEFEHLVEVDPPDDLNLNNVTCTDCFSVSLQLFFGASYSANVINAHGFRSKIFVHMYSGGGGGLNI